MEKGESMWNKSIPTEERAKIEEYTKNQPLKEGFKDGLFFVAKKDNNQILEGIVNEMQNEIVEKESLVNTSDTENSVQRLNNLNKDLIKLKEMEQSEETKTKIKETLSEIDNVIRSN